VNPLLAGAGWKGVTSVKLLIRLSIAAASLGGSVLLAFGVLPSVVAQAAAPTTLYVAQGGVNSGSCPATSPCATITYALTQAGANPTIEVSGTIDDHVAATAPVTITGADAPVGSPAILNGTDTGTDLTVSEAAVKIDDLTIEGGSGGDGGGISNPDGSLTIAGSTISGNSSSNAGAGIFSEGPLTITDSTISGNSAGGSGGAIYNWGGTVTITDSTISENSAASGAVAILAGSITTGATILAGNIGGNCSGSSGFVDVGYNLTNDATGTACGFTRSTDKVNMNPDLGSLANNGGLTETMLPALSSPATDAIPKGTTLNGVSVCPGTDQRGYARPGPGESHCSIGAVEAGLGSTKVSLVSSANPGTTGVAVTYTATVSPLPGGGTMKFTSDGKAITGCTSKAVNNTTGKATCKVTYTTAGSFKIKAAYSGDGAFARSTSKALTETVNT
jgi:hypothetical protein